MSETDTVADRIVPVLAGGGGRLSAHVGALQAIAHLGIAYHSLVGVSGGSIVGALLAAGHSLEEICRLTRETDFSRFLSPSIVSLLRTGGLSSGDSFEAWLSELTYGRSFAELAPDYHVVATDVRTGLPVVLSRHSHPDIPVAQAVRFSMSVPIMWSFKEFGEHLLVQTFMIALSREYINEDFWLSTRGIPPPLTSLSAVKRRSACVSSGSIPPARYCPASWHEEGWGQVSHCSITAQTVMLQCET